MVLGILGEVALLVVTVADDALLYVPFDDLALSVVGAACVLGHPVRRRVLSRLTDEPRVELEELAATLADDDAVPTDDPDRIAVALHHNPLPRLDDELYVEYDHRNGDVVLWKDPETVTAKLDAD